MKKLIYLFLLLLITLSSCSRSNDEKLGDEIADSSKTCVEILYFHGDMRCKNCYAMEKGVSELLDEKFKKEVEDGSVIFKKIDITSSDGEKVADNYGVTWSSLFLNDWKEGKENREDLTRFGMQNAVKHPDIFKNEIEQKIRKSLAH